MLKLLVLSCLLIQAYAGILPNAPRRFPRSGGAPRLDGRIVGGTPADITDAPYQVALLLDWYGIGLFSQACGGSILTEKVIVSAGHCPEDTTAKQWKIRAGSTIKNSGGQLVEVTKTLTHENYDEWELDFDISLFYLSSSLTIDNKLTAPIKLPAQGAAVADGALALVTGWGTTTEDGSTPTSLRQVTIPIINQDTCVAAYDGFNPVTNNMICAGNLKNGGEDACQGDSGGPLAIDGVLIGITSWGKGCARAGFPGVWTRVPAFRDWIDSNL